MNVNGPGLAEMQNETVLGRMISLLEEQKPFADKLSGICSLIPESFPVQDGVCVSITFENQRYEGSPCPETEWVERCEFETPDSSRGIIEVHFQAGFPAGHKAGDPRLHRFLQHVASLITGYVSSRRLSKLLYDNTERIKELKGIRRTSEVLRKGNPLKGSLQEICSFLPEAWQYPQDCAVRIVFDNMEMRSREFEETRWVMKQMFETPDNRKGSIEVFYLREFPEAYEGPFLKEERDLIDNLASLISGTVSQQALRELLAMNTERLKELRGIKQTNLITGSATKDILNNLLHENRERVKELHVINLTTHIISRGKPVDETLKEICAVIPRSWQYPRYTAVRITFEGKTWSSREFRDTPWLMRETFVSFDNKRGSIDIFYLKDFPPAYEGPFLKEERQLITNIGRLISGYLNTQKGREIYNDSQFRKTEPFNPDDYRQTLIRNKRPLQLMFNQQSLEKYIYLDMMKYKIKEILFVATLYDAFILENEDSFFEQFMGIIYQYSLFSLPRITGATTPEEALDLLETANFDIAILMVGIDRETPVWLSNKIREKRPSMPVYMLLNQKSNIRYFEELVPCLPSVNKLFVWSGNSQIFFAMVKLIEDAANVENDTRIGLVRIILLVEDSAHYYSKYLQMLYSIVFGQVQQVLPEVEKNELDKISKMRSRPKILLAGNYEEAMFIFNKYKDFILCVITDMEFDRDGKIDKTAGVKFINYIKSHILNLPIILQSSEKSNEMAAKSLNVGFINKNSETLLNDLKKFITFYLGFGDFVFRNREGEPIAVAKTLREFEALLYEIPDETFYLHAVENQFSLWLMARGEIELARTLNPMRIRDFKDARQSRSLFLETFRQYRETKKRGKVLGFDETATMDEKNIMAFSAGSYGGKGRGLAFISALVYNHDFGAIAREINIRTPITAIVGTDAFDRFIEIPEVHRVLSRPNASYQEIREVFVQAGFPPSLVKKLEFFVEQVQKPVAVRSSSLSEDSLTQPFAGVFDTYIIPNDRRDKNNVLENLIIAIKLVFASVYSDNSKTYFQAIHHKVEEEKMAVILQELVGDQYGDYYYPHISGVAQSYNYYPVAHMKPEEGFAVAAVGLGSYVVEGWKSFRFSPRYPKIEMYANRDLLNSTQLKFYALNTAKGNVDYVSEGELASLELLEISEAEKHGTLTHSASVYLADNDRIEPGLSAPGPRVIDFGDILRFGYIPLAETIDVMLGTIEEALGSPVEIEYAVDLNRTLNGLPSFYLLQIKPLVGSQLNFNADFSRIDRSDIILFTTSSLGNGEVTHIRDVLYVDNEAFDKLKTREIAKEVEQLNAKMILLNREYILIGPGRWGTRDPFLGIPVVWSQISNARVIVEVSLSNFPLDSSLGSHFFHNVTSMNIGYFSVRDICSAEYIQWQKLGEGRLIEQTKYIRHVCFDTPLHVLMNGKQKTAVIMTVK